MNAYKTLAILVLIIHALWTLLIIFGYIFAWKRAILRWVHIGLLCYDVFIEVAPFPCPLTVAETWLETQAGITPYQRPFWFTTSKRLSTPIFRKLCWSHAPLSYSS